MRNFGQQMSETKIRIHNVTAKAIMKQSSGGKGHQNTVSGRNEGCTNFTPL